MAESVDNTKLASADPILLRSRKLALSNASKNLSKYSTVLNVCGVIYGTDRRDGASPFGNGNDEAVGVATLTMIASRLIRGILDSTKRRDIYCAGALARQLVEVEYLFWAFSNEKRDAAEWLRSNSTVRKQKYQPRHIHEDSNKFFSTSDYGHHCEVGGHPTPQMRHLLFHDDPIALDILINDCCHHCSRIMIYFLKWLERYDFRNADQFATIIPTIDFLRRHMSEDGFAREVRVSLDMVNP